MKIVLSAMLLLAACTPGTSIKISPATPAPEDGLVEVMRRAFMDSCMDGGNSRSMCACGFDHLIERYTIDEILDMSDAKIDQVGLELALLCYGR